MESVLNADEQVPPPVVPKKKREPKKPYEPVPCECKEKGISCATHASW